MSKTEPTKLTYQDHKLWAKVRGLNLPQAIEWHAKGWIRQDKDAYLMEVRQHKPHHTKGRKPRFYLVLAPQRRPLITTDYKAGWLEYSKR